MRIFFAAPRSAWVDLNLRASLQAMGHSLVEFRFPGWPDDADPAWAARGKPATNQRLLNAFRGALDRGPIDLLFGYFYSSVAYPETIRSLGAFGVPTVNFSCNNVHQFDLVQSIAPHFDACIVPEKMALPVFEAVGARPLRIQLAANPRVYRPCPEPRRYDVTFVGQRYADRADFLHALRRAGIDARAWGAGWQPRKRLSLDLARAALALVEDEQADGVVRLLRQRFGSPRAGRPLPTPTPPGEVLDTSVFGGPRLLHRDLVRMFSRSHVSLGFATAGASHRSEHRLMHLRLRDFEAPMSGALYLTERQAELDEYYRVGSEVLGYTDGEDLVDQARYYLARPEQAERIRRAGYHRAVREHTWERRFQELFAAMGIREKGALR